METVKRQYVRKGYGIKKLKNILARCVSLNIYPSISPRNALLILKDLEELAPSDNYKRNMFIYKKADDLRK